RRVARTVVDHVHPLRVFVHLLRALVHAMRARNVVRVHTGIVPGPPALVLDKCRDRQRATWSPGRGGGIRPGRRRPARRPAGSARPTVSSPCAPPAASARDRTARVARSSPGSSATRRTCPPPPRTRSPA